MTDTRRAGVKDSNSKISGHTADSHSASQSVQQKSESTCRAEFKDNRVQSKAQSVMQHWSLQDSRISTLENSQGENPIVASQFHATSTPIQRILSDDLADFLMGLLKTNFTGDDAYPKLSPAEIDRIYRNAVENGEARSKSGVLSLLRKAIKEIISQRGSESDNVASSSTAALDTENSEEVPVMMTEDYTITIELPVYETLYNLVMDYDIAMQDGDVGRNQEDRVTSMIGERLGAIHLFINQDEELKYALDNIFLKSVRDKEAKKYEELSFMQILGSADKGFDCHNAIASALLACLSSMKLA